MHHHIWMVIVKKYNTVDVLYQTYKPLNSIKSSSMEKTIGVIVCIIFHSHEKAKEAIIYSYNKHINGFAALLEEEEAADIASENASSVINIFQS